MNVEYRITWKRVGCRPKSKLFFGRATAEKFARLFGPEPWTHYAGDKSADDLVCCSGHQCGCGGLTYRQQSDAQRARQPGLEYVRLRARRVDPWITLPSEVADAALLSEFVGVQE